MEDATLQTAMKLRMQTFANSRRRGGTARASAVPLRRSNRQATKASMRIRNAAAGSQLPSTAPRSTLIQQDTITSVIADANLPVYSAPEADMTDSASSPLSSIPSSSIDLMDLPDFNIASAPVTEV